MRYVMRRRSTCANAARLGGGPASQAGFAVPTVMLMLFAASAIVAVAITSAVNAQRGATRDSDTKAALNVAEAGVSQAILHYNRVPTTNAAPCVVTTGGTVTNTGTVGGWCPWSTGSAGGDSFAYTVQPGDGEIEIVSRGNADGVLRRVDVNAVSSGGQQLFADASVKTQDFITMDSNAQVLAGMATNGDISLRSNARVCGTASVGLGRSLTLAGNAGWYQGYDHPNCVTPMNPSNVPQTGVSSPRI
jgi:type II secretory pathway pseudopilin PulG